MSEINSEHTETAHLRAKIAQLQRDNDRLRELCAGQREVIRGWCAGSSEIVRAACEYARSPSSTRLAMKLDPDQPTGAGLSRLITAVRAYDALIEATTT